MIYLFSFLLKGVLNVQIIGLFYSRSQRKEQSHITIRNSSQTVSNGNATVMFSFELEDKYYILVYSALVCGVFLFELIRSLVFYWVAIAASQNLHNRMLTSLIGTDIGFFILNPIGM